MSNKIAAVLIILLIITNAVVIYCYYNSGDSLDLQYKEKIDSLNYNVDSLEIINKSLLNRIDSLSNKIITTDSVIVRIDHWYEKNLDSISSLPDDGQLRFFSDYLSKNSSRLFNSHNKDSIKTN